MKLTFRGILYVLAASIGVNTAQAALTWHQAAPGLFYVELHPKSRYPLGKIHAFKIDLLRYQLTATLAREFKQPLATARYFTKKNPSLITTNGGFFTPSLQPLGLRINNKEVKNPLKTISWWGVFYTQGNHAFIVSSRAYKPNPSVDFAVQGGPRLIINNRIPRLKPGRDERTAIGITHDGDIILLVTDNLPLTTKELAQIMRRKTYRGGLNCVNALNLDGGGSTQMYAHIHNLIVHVVGLTGVTDAVQVVKRIV